MTPLHVRTESHGADQEGSFAAFLRLPTAIVVSLACLTTGCSTLLLRSPETTDVAQLLPRNKASRESVAVEIMLVLVPPQRMPALQTLWDHVDEQVIDSQVRHRLTGNGLRAGVLGTEVPDELAELLQLESDPAQDESPWQTASLEDVPTVTRHVRQLRPNKRSEVQSSPVRSHLDLCISKCDAATGHAFLSGQTYASAQGIYALKWSPLPQNRINLQLTPELHHGEPKTGYGVGEDNQWQYDYGRKKEVFDDLQIQVPLSAGQLLVLAATPEGKGSVGEYFHTVPAQEGPQQRLILIRMLQIADEQ